jgi:hypothetical protein
MASNLTAAPRGLRLRTTRQLHCQRPIYALRSLELRVARSPVWWYSPVPLFCALFHLAPSSANANQLLDCAWIDRSDTNFRHSPVSEFSI